LEIVPNFFEERGCVMAENTLYKMVPIVSSFGENCLGNLPVSRIVEFNKGQQGIVLSQKINTSETVVLLTTGKKKRYSLQFFDSATIVTVKGNLSGWYPDTEQESKLSSWGNLEEGVVFAPGLVVSNEAEPVTQTHCFLCHKHKDGLGMFRLDGTFVKTKPEDTDSSRVTFVTLEARMVVQV
jgi:hypothetical protein